ncbi:hypothetical protein KL930_001855 [Ogataea haglerorum]|uniref:DNA/RNA-binding protein Alba-like domain-containing protein n=1 Tax=Ogataea haglerorum TaxID=1937702 RepID=A0AAN6D8I5_9ASCO|nr:uncharacterized protein KL911_001796 [Ogataea haglerorum]KAG7698193.1 hypothetical protein KL915_001910 [Ogataea haglerorum]KAG7699513.1 hypothetical protein KL951_001230 [Ogataea haglerorum]KAG7710558.1 hypothetical protein KL950_001471 [Ogataea haglerorum]KAG7721179.1 hypothetical protein KL913_000915 [Ogataea haglerorum]KAG7721933.1 hypothetical protein KL949_000911 [Ogataea haglerorum]
MDEAVLRHLQRVPNLEQVVVRKNDGIKEKLDILLSKCEQTPANIVLMAENDGIQKLLTVVEIMKRKHPSHQQFNKLTYREKPREVSVPQDELRLQKPMKLPILYIYLHIGTDDSKTIDMDELKSQLADANWSCQSGPK